VCYCYACAICDHDVTTRHRQRTAASEIAYERDDIGLLLRLLTDRHRTGKLRSAVGSRVAEFQEYGCTGRKAIDTAQSISNEQPATLAAACTMSVSERRRSALYVLQRSRRAARVGNSGG